MATWTNITATLCKPHPPDLGTNLTSLMLRHADHSIQETYETHTTWNILHKDFTPTPQFTTTPARLRTAIHELDPTYKSTPPQTIPSTELTAWSSLSILALTDGIDTLNTQEARALATISQPPTRALLTKHTSFHAPTNTYGPTPHFTTSATFFYFELHNLIPSDRDTATLNLTPNPSPPPDL